MQIHFSMHFLWFIVARKYKKKIVCRPYGNYADSTIEDALGTIVNGELSVLAASKRYSIPYGTLYNHFHGKHVRTTGGQTVFSEDEEKSILSAVMKCG
ncbi:unnamed protein product [Macrosiphum euphorbiae]|uniref:HTH psq-type domain-containing protein n=1 Tax=Macrosiphum euphorbiae TaxID=13131 RepID=A0AAV0WSS1_9HEMI|nr:unnamed protein product [Macrosiphum euphorbiae]